MNTVNVNDLNTAQQIMLFLMPMLTNPITINSFVVFLRLYWFEKRFSTSSGRRGRDEALYPGPKPRRLLTRAKLRRASMAGIFTIMRNGGQPRITNDGILLYDARNQFPGKDAELANGRANGNGTVPRDDLEPTSSLGEGRRPEIKFANTVKRSDGLQHDEVKLPPTRTDEEHIAILERQRNVDDEVLRIPGPRETERGARPSRVQLGDAEEPEPDPKRRESSDSEDGPLPARTNENRPQTITIAEPAKRRETDSTGDDFVEHAKLLARVFSFLRFRKPRVFNKEDKKYHHHEDELHARPSITRRRTLDQIRTAFSRDKEDQAPYLSWQPTLGRNSAFPDLTEEQREELGGIEYRSLKTLALILTIYFWGLRS